VQSNISLISASLGQQQIATIPDRDLRDFGKSLQQPRQCHFQPDMIVRDIEMTGRRLTQRANAEDHAITFPTFFINLQHWNAGGCARQSRLKAARRFFTAQAMRNRNDKRCGHFSNPSAELNACNSGSFRKEEQVARLAFQKWNFLGFRTFFR
jgi:hypothetical protein